MRNYTGRSTVAGVFSDRDDAARAIHELRDVGFKPEDVGVAMRDRTARDELVAEGHSKATEGAVSGVLGGGLLGGVVGFLVGIGALAIPGLGPVIAGGALASAFGLAGGTAVAGAGIGAAAGGIVGALVGMGIPEEEARHLETGFRAGGVLVTVRGGERALEALAILDRNGADTGPGSIGAAAEANRAQRESVVRPTTKTRDATEEPDHSGAGEIAGGTLAGAAAGAVAGSAIAGPGGTVVGGAMGALEGGAAGKSVHENRDPQHDDQATEGAMGGAIAGGVTGAAIGTVVAGPAGTAAGAAIGGAAGAVTGATAGAEEDDDDKPDQPTTVTVR